MKVRTRFAPSPTGYMHVGNLRTALYAYLWAKKNKGTFILRIEDTDQERIVEGSVELIYRTLEETGLIHDEGPDKGGNYGPYIQHERKPIYRKYAEQLIEKGVAYYCFCDKERLEELRTSLQLRKLPFRYDGRCKKLSKEEVQQKLAAGVPHVVRQNIPTLGATAFSDEVYGTITVDNSTLDDQVLVKSDGLPTYNFANVVDDHLMEISHVIRGSEYLSSTPKYNLLYQAFGWEIPHYVHCSQVMRDAQHKLSKRDGDASYADFVEKGYLKEAIINYIALLGWNPGTEREKFTLEELVEAFDLERDQPLAGHLRRPQAHLAQRPVHPGAAAGEIPRHRAALDPQGREAPGHRPHEDQPGAARAHGEALRHPRPARFHRRAARLFAGALRQQEDEDRSGKLAGEPEGDPAHARVAAAVGSRHAAPGDLRPDREAGGEKRAHPVAAAHCAIRQAVHTRRRRRAGRCPRPGRVASPHPQRHRAAGEKDFWLRPPDRGRIPQAPPCRRG